MKKTAWLMAVLAGSALMLAGCEKDVKEARRTSSSPLSSGPSFQSRAKATPEKQGARQTNSAPVNLFPHERSAD